MSVLQTDQTPYNWVVSFAGFQRPAKEKLVIYELLVRDFLTEQNYETLSDTLDYLKKLGVNAIELMPVTEFAGNNSWGYNPIYYLAPDKAYGTREALKTFIDRCHQNGIAIIMDIVFNQADYDFPYVKMYWENGHPAANSPMFNQAAPHPYSVFYDFNQESKDTQDYIDSTVIHWIKQYKIDGYRFDLTKGFTNKQTNESNVSNYDASRIGYLKRIYDKINNYDASAYVILEHFCDNTEEKELSDYGMMIWGNGSFDFSDIVNGDPKGVDWINFKSGRGWSDPNIVGYMESHDEERMIYDALKTGSSAGDYDASDLATALNRAKAAATIFFPIPGPKMLWQFEELGYDKSINYCDENTTYNTSCRTSQKPVLWDYNTDPARLALKEVFTKLIKLKTSVPAFSNVDAYTGYLSGNDIVKRFKIDDPSLKVFGAANFDLQSTSFSASFTHTGIWYDFFSGAEVYVSDVNQTLTYGPGEYHIYTSSPVVLAVDSELENNNASIYPNPAGDVLNFQFSKIVKYSKVKISNISGTHIKSFETNELAYQLSLKDFLPGMYLVEINTNQGKTFKKFIKE